MKKYNWLLSLILVIMSAGAVMAAAPVEDAFAVGAGARPIGMGLAFVALADDANAAFINPAGLGNLKTPQITSMFGNLMGDVTYMLFGGVYPTSMGNFGLSYLASNSSDLQATSIDPVSGRVVANGAFGYDSNIIMLSYGKEIEFVAKGLYAGANVKMFSQGFSTVSAANALNADVGLLYKATDWLNVGFTRQNTWPGSWGGQLNWGNGAQKQNVLVNNKIGATVKPVGWPVLASLDLDVNSSNKLFHAGAEWMAFKNDVIGVAVRGGLEQKQNAGLGKSLDLTLGLGLEAGNIGFDYAYQTVYDEPSAVTHYFSFSYKFNGAAKDKDVKVSQVIKGIKS